MGSNPTPGANHGTHGVLGEILCFGFWMRKEGYRNSTIRASINTIKAVAKRTDLLDPETVKGWLTTISASINRKEKICQDLARFYMWKGTQFNMPRYQRILNIPFIPLEAEVDQVSYRPIVGRIVG